MAFTTFNFMTLENLTTYHGELTSWAQAQIANATASSIKTVSISKDAETGISTMHFYTVEAPVGEAQAAFSIELPHDYYTEAEIDALVQEINGDIEAVDGKADAAQAAAEAAQGSADAAQGAVDALAAKVGEVADGETVMGKIADNAGDIADLQAIVSELTGDDTNGGSISDTIDAKIEALDLPNTYEAKGTAAEEAGKVQEALDAYIEANDAVVDGKADKATTLAGYGITDAMTADAIAAAIKVETDRAVAKEGEIAQSVTAVDGKVDGVAGDLAGYKTSNDARVKAIEDDYLKAVDKEALEAKDEELAGAIAAEKARMDAFLKLEDGQTLNAALDTLKELQDFITSEAGAADEIVEKVADLEAIVAGIGGEGEEATVVAYVTKAIEALKIGDYAKAADLTAAVDRITAVEGRMTTAEGKVTALEGKAHEHTFVESELNKIVDGDVAKWNSAQANAEAKAAELDAALKGELEGKINGVDAKFADYTKTTDMNTAIADAVKVETDRATGEEGKLAGRLDALEAVAHGVAAIDEADIKALFA